MSDIFLDFIPTAESFRFALATDAGDIKTDDGLKSAVIYSLFTDRLANIDDIIPDGSTNRRGHWGDAYLGIENESEGSRLWLLSREKQTDETLNKAVTYAKESLQWLIDELIASQVNILAEWYRTGVLALKIEIEIIDGQKFSDTFEVTL